MRLVIVAVLTIIGSAFLGASARADTGDCASNNNNKFSSVCYYRDTQFSGAYVEWQSAPLNITQSAANAGEYIAQHLILHDRWSNPAAFTFLEVGDTAGGGGMPGHAGEWARIWYWVDYTQQSYTENFIQYGTSDGLNRSWGMQWESSESAWVIYIAGARKATVTTWKQPYLTADMQIITGLEIHNGLRPLDASKNSGLFVSKNHQWRDLNSQWWGWDMRWQQVDDPCGSAPSCLQGWWSGQWNNAKPAQ